MLGQAVVKPGSGRQRPMLAVWSVECTHDARKFLPRSRIGTYDLPPASLGVAEWLTASLGAGYEARVGYHVVLCMRDVLTRETRFAVPRRDRYRISATSPNLAVEELLWVGVW